MLLRCMVRPIVEYCSVVWNPSLIKDINAIEAVHNCAEKVHKAASWNETPYISPVVHLIEKFSLID